MNEAPDLVGKQIGRYHVLSLLGSGGMGVVYDATDPALGRHVALKILPPDLVSNSNRLQRFIQEAKAASALNHPHLVSIYEIGSSDSDGQRVEFIAMEKIDGKTLRDVLAGELLPIRKALEIVAQVAEAVAATHSVGIVHRDLKPENIMVSSAGYAKVLDFGLAKLRAAPSFQSADNEPTAATMTKSGVIVGSAGYMSPEQAQGKRDVDHRTDIFALGCILYEVMTGRRAFRGQSSVDTLHKIMYDEPEPVTRLLPSAPAELQRIIRKAIAKDPDERYQSAKDLAVDLRALSRDLRSPRRAEVQPLRRRTHALTILTLAILVIATTATIIFLRRARVAPVAPTIAFQRITAKGNLGTIRISPDGRFIAYSQLDENGASLWLRQLASGEDLQLVPPAPAGYIGCTFTPDGNAIVYALKNASEPRGALYSVSTIGGPPQRLLSGADSAPTFAPGGKRMAWLRADFPKVGESALMVANSDGSAERMLANRRSPELFAPIFFARPSWSPDGKMIAASVKRLKNPDSAMLIGFDPDSGKEKQLTDSHWVSLSALEWLPDQSGIVVIGAADTASIHALSLTGTQIWLVPYPSGAPRRVTNDLLYYRETSISTDGKKLVADVADATVHIWRKSASDSKKISSGHLDGVAGITVMPDGRLTFSSIERGTTTLWIMNADGTKRRQLVRQPSREEYPAAFSGGIAYVSSTTKSTELCVTNSEDEGRRVVISGVDDAPIAASPSGDAFVYVANDRLWKISADGKTRQQLTQQIASAPAYSPSGDRIAFISSEAENSRNRILVIPADGSRVIWSGPPLPPGAHWLRWAPDGKALLVAYWGRNVWLFPLRGEPKQLTNFDDGTWSFDVAPDGTLFLARGSLTRDAVLITGFR